MPARPSDLPTFRGSGARAWRASVGGGTRQASPTRRDALRSGRTRARSSGRPSSRPRPYGATPVDGLLDNATTSFTAIRRDPGTACLRCRDKHRSTRFGRRAQPETSARHRAKRRSGVLPTEGGRSSLCDMFTLPGRAEGGDDCVIVRCSVQRHLRPCPAPTASTPGLTKSDCKTAGSARRPDGVTDEKVAAQRWKMHASRRRPQRATGRSLLPAQSHRASRAPSGAFFVSLRPTSSLVRPHRGQHHSQRELRDAPGALAGGSVPRRYRREKSGTSIGRLVGAAHRLPFPSSRAPWSGPGSIERDISPRVRDLTPSRSLAPLATSSRRTSRTGRTRRSASSSRPWPTRPTPPSTRRRPSVPFALSGLDTLGSPATAGSSRTSRPSSAMTGYALNFAGADWPLALNVTDKTCRGGRAKSKRGTGTEPGHDDHSGAHGLAWSPDVIWGFATRVSDKLDTAAATSNVRCNSEHGHRQIAPSAAPTASSNPVCGSGRTPVWIALRWARSTTPRRPWSARHSNFTPREELTTRRDAPAPHHHVRGDGRTVSSTRSTRGSQGGPELHHELWAFAPPAVLEARRERRRQPDHLDSPRREGSRLGPRGDLAQRKRQSGTPPSWQASARRAATAMNVTDRRLR